MREKLLNLMKSEKLTASKLAELLDIQPSGISHILGGRNKPSFDLVQKILRRFPQINPDWLLLDKDEMYRSDIVQSQTPVISNDSHDNSNYSMTQSGAGSSSAQAPTVSPLSPSAQQMVAAIAPKHGNVKCVIILFDDHTFESFEVR